MKELKGAGKTYSGSPADIVVELSKEVQVALSNAGITPTGAHIIAAIWAIACAVHNGNAQDNSELGKMPSYKILLSVLIRGLTGRKWTQEEHEEFDVEFVEIVKSLGGAVLQTPASYTTSSPLGPLFVSPASKEIH